MIWNQKIQGLKGGAEDYIVKPFEILELLVRMEKVLERTNKLSQTIKILNMEINFEEHSVKQNGQEVLLKPKEFELYVFWRKIRISLYPEKTCSVWFGD